MIGVSLQQSLCRPVLVSIYGNSRQIFKVATRSGSLAPLVNLRAWLPGKLQTVKVVEQLERERELHSCSSELQRYSSPGRAHMINVLINGSGARLIPCLNTCHQLPTNGLCTVFSTSPFLSLCLHFARSPLSFSLCFSPSPLCSCLEVSVGLVGMLGSLELLETRQGIRFCVLYLINTNFQPLEPFVIIKMSRLRIATILSF